MESRVLILSLVAVVSVPVGLGAQTQAPTPSEARTQVYQFEKALKTAVDVGGQRLAERAKALVPEIMLTPSEVPIARGLRLRWGYHFDVQVPNIDKTSIAIFEMYRQPQSSRSQGPAANQGQPVSSNRLGAPVPDPLGALEAFEADKEYGARVTDALMDTMVDNSAGLTITADEELILSVSAMDPADSRVLLIEPKRILTIKGADLLELRQGKITRDQAKARIQLSSF